MKKVIYKCDNCGKEEEVWCLESLLPPQHWFTLGYQDLEGKWSDTHHFCSKKCMNNALEARSKIIG